MWTTRLRPRDASKRGVRRRIDDRLALPRPRQTCAARCASHRSATRRRHAAIQHAKLGMAQTRGVLQCGLKHRLQLAGGRADDAQHFRGRGLLLQRLAQLALEQRELASRPSRKQASAPSRASPRPRDAPSSVAPSREQTCRACSCRRLLVHLLVDPDRNREREGRALADRRTRPRFARRASRRCAWRSPVQGRCRPSSCVVERVGLLELLENLALIGLRRFPARCRAPRA